MKFSALPASALRNWITTTIYLARVTAGRRGISPSAAILEWLHEP